jgi:uncharacterized protein YbjQ (UPF0145 family)
MKNLVFAVLILATGCVSISHHVTGTVRPPVPQDEVKVYATMPAKSKTIGTVSITSFRSMPWEDAYVVALKELKIETGKLGANGLVIMDYGSTNYSELNGATIDGKAIFVELAKAN